MTDSMMLEINGVPYTGFVGATASKSMTDICGEYLFNVSALSDLQKFPIKNRSPCRVLVNNKPFITGYVEKIIISYDSNQHDISIIGRDKTCDIVDNTIGGGLSFTAGVSLQDIIKKVLTVYGLQNSIGVNSNIDINVFTRDELNNIASQVGETAFVFIERYAKKRQVLVMSDGNGNISLVRASKQQIKTILSYNPTVQPTLLNSQITYDDTKRFYEYVLWAQQNSVSGSVIEDVNNINHTNAKIVSMKAKAYDEAIRKTRICNLLQHDDSYNQQQDLQDRAQWEANYRMATGFKYSCKVQGFSPINDPDLIWQPNMLVSIYDPYCDVANKSEPILLLIKSVSFKYSLEEGSTTTLEFVDKDGYSVDVMQGVKYNRKHSAGKKVTQSGVVSDVSPYQRMK
jgi:prophage tail gpP-like protein